ncbi:MAG: glycosyltransferase family 4 protein [Hyphomicrobium sp.]
MSHAFDAMVARRYVPRTQAVHGFEYTALATFERARELGVATILHLPSLDSRAYELIQHREKANWPELTAEQDPYFHTKFERRYERRQKEIALADVIIANSQLTARSHIAAGADPEKVFVARLGAPPVHRVVQRNPHSLNQPLSVIWAGAFSLRKGAHYLIDALKRLDAREQIQVNVYGELTAPERLLRAAPNTVKFHGSVPRTILFEAFTHADVLVFPTLSDGFGMVITEALAHGLPVITTDCAGAAELIGPDNGVIVPSSDAAALADALRWCLDNRKQLFEMREDAAKAAHSRQWVDFRRDLIDVIEKGLSKTGFNPAFKRAA